MPNMANITVKKNDGTTDITYTGVVPSAGDGSAAVWKSQTVGTAIAHQPEARMASRDGAKGARRQVRVTYQYPQIATNTTTGVTSVIDRLSFDGNWTVPKGMAQTDINEAASQIANLIASVLFKDSVKSGYAPS